MTDLLFAGTVFMGFFAIMNPIGNTPIFLGIVSDFDEKTKRKIALKCTIMAFIIVAIFVIAGSIIFKLFGITLAAFQIAGGILLFFVGFHLLQGKESKVHHPHENERNCQNSPKDVAITPLAIPILAGPGTIATAMNFVGLEHSIYHISIVIIVFAISCLITYICFVLGEKILTIIKPGIVKVITRIMGLILTVIAIQMIICGIHGAIIRYYH